MMRLLLRVVVCSARLGCNLVQFVSDRLGDNSTRLASCHSHPSYSSRNSQTQRSNKSVKKNANPRIQKTMLTIYQMSIWPCCHQIVATKLLPPNSFALFPPACFYAVGNLSGALTGKILDNNSIILNYFPPTPSNFHFFCIFFSGNRGDNA